MEYISCTVSGTGLPILRSLADWFKVPDIRGLYGAEWGEGSSSCAGGERPSRL